MPVVDEENRTPELRRLGMSNALVRLSSGECLHERFRFSCLGPSSFVYSGAGTPDGPLFVPMWDRDDMVFGVWERDDGPEFIYFDIEAHEEFTSISRTEQGFWTAQFDFFYECGAPEAELHEVANIVDFKFLDRHLSSRAAAEARLNTFQGHEAWLREMITGIDHETLLR